MISDGNILRFLYFLFFIFVLFVQISIIFQLILKINRKEFFLMSLKFATLKERTIFSELCIALN